MPNWLTYLAIASLLIAALCAIGCILDLLAHPQHMWIMNVVWPLTILWSGPLGLWAYYTLGRTSTQERFQAAKQHGREPAARHRPHWQATALGATHCGAGCTLGDICAEWLAFAIPAITLFGTTIRLELFGHRIFATWIIDFIFAFLFGIAFQYFTIVPMRQLSLGQGLLAAVKADTLSLTAWQVGMYGWMAIIVFVIFGHELEKTNPVFWFMMQIAMLAGFCTSYPVNWWLICAGLKEKM